MTWSEEGHENLEFLFRMVWLSLSQSLTRRDVHQNQAGPDTALRSEENVLCRMMKKTPENPFRGAMESLLLAHSLPTTLYFLGIK